MGFKGDFTEIMAGWGWWFNINTDFLSESGFLEL